MHIDYRNVRVKRVLNFFNAGTAEGESSVSNNMLVSLKALLSGQSIMTYDFKRIVFVGKQKNRALYLKSC